MPEIEGWRAEQLKRADAALSGLIEANPGCSVDGDGPEWLVGTNLVTFGALNGEPVVYKYFDWLPRKMQEESALRLFAPTGVVPKLYPVESDSVLVMERLRGQTLNVVEQGLGEGRLQHLYYQLGQAMAKMVVVAPGGRARGRRDLSAKPGFDYEFYCQADLDVLFDTVIGRAAGVLAEQDVPHRTILERSLTALRDHGEAILARPGFVQTDDFHTSNVMAAGSELTGFIDLEMTRWGNEVLLLAAALAMMDERPERWAWIRRGYEHGRGARIDSELSSLARIAVPFSQWIRFMWYWTTEDASALEPGARGWPIRDIKATAEALEEIQV